MMQSNDDNDRERTYFIGYVTPGLWQHLGISSGAKSVATVLLLHRSEGGGCYPTEVLIAAELDCSVRNVRRHLIELREAGLITWEARKAPRGKAKSRAHRYDLSGLLALRAHAPMKAQEVFEARGQTERTKTTRRERTKTTPHASEFAGIQSKQNKCYKKIRQPESSAAPGTSALIVCPGSVMEKKQNEEKGERTKTTPRSARISEYVAASPHSTAFLTQRRVNEHLLGPDGLPVADYGDEYGSNPYAESMGTIFEVELNDTIRELYGRWISGKAVRELVQMHGVRYCNFQRVWLPYRVADSYRRGKPVPKPTGLFVNAVREQWEVKPSWTRFPFDEDKHTVAARNEARSAQPPNAEPAEQDADDLDIPF